MTLICEQLVTKHTLELLGREMLVALEAVAQGTSEGVALHLPELGDLNACGVKFQGGTHRGEELGTRLASHEDEEGFVLEGVDGVDDVVVAAEVELVGGLFRENLLQGGDVCRGIDAEETFLQSFHLHLSNRLAGGHQLAVDVGDAHAVAVHDGQMPDAAAHEALGTPGADASHTKEYHPLLGDTFHRLTA